MAKLEKKYIIKLSEEERTYLAEKIAAGGDSARSLRRARILLKADQNELESSENSPNSQDTPGCSLLPIALISIPGHFARRKFKNAY